MKLLLLRVLLQRRSKDEGFTLPMVIALGLVMILLGMVNVLQSGEQNVNTILESQRIDALAVAELGAAQYRQLFDRNRALILQNRNEWTSITDVCDTITDTTNGWANNDNDSGSSTYDATMWRSISLNEVDLGTDLNGDGDTTDEDQSVNVGSYKIVDYEFDLDGIVGDTDSGTAGIQYDTDDDSNFDQRNDNQNDLDGNGESDARGILTVKARTPGNDASEAQLEYEIPVRINENDLDNLAPALWINTSNPTNLGTLDINNNGNLVISHRIGDGQITWDGEDLDPCEDPDNLTIGANTISVVSDPRGVPPISTLRDFIDNIDTNGDGTGDGLPPASLNNLNFLSNIETGFPNLLGNLGDAEYDDGDPDNDPILYYKTTGALTLNSDLKTDGIADVILYVNGDLTVNSGATNVGNDDPNNTSTNLQISSTGNVTVKTAGGTINIIGLIHAPNGTFKVEGNGTVNIIGSVWANDIDASGATVNITPDETDTGNFNFEDSYAYYIVADHRDPKPITQPPSNWKTLEVN